MPYLLTFGPNEYANFRQLSLHEHFSGPHFYSIEAQATAGSFFLGQYGQNTISRWQLEWLAALLGHGMLHTPFVFIQPLPIACRREQHC